VPHPVHHRQCVTLAERRPAEGRISGQRSEREHVGGRANWPFGHLLGGHVLGRADPEAAAGERAHVCRPRDPEIDDPRAVGRQHDIRRLQVAVHYAGGVDHLQGLGYTSHQHEYRVDRERAVAADCFLQRWPGYERRHQPRRIRVRIGVQYLRGVEAVNPAGCVGFLAKAITERRVGSKLRPHRLERDGPAARCERQVDRAHAASAKPGMYPVPAYLPRIFAGQRLHLAGSLSLPRGPDARAELSGFPDPGCLFARRR
jgi:hypothetical protein